MAAYLPIMAALLAGASALATGVSLTLAAVTVTLVLFVAFRHGPRRSPVRAAAIAQSAATVPFANRRHPSDRRAPAPTIARSATGPVVVNAALFGEFTLTLLGILDPPGAVPVFLAVTQSMSATQRLRAARTAVLAAFAVIVFAAVGEQILTTSGVGASAASRGRVAVAPRRRATDAGHRRPVASRRVGRADEHRDGAARDTAVGWSRPDRHHDPVRPTSRYGPRHRRHRRRDRCSATTAAQRRSTPTPGCWDVRPYSSTGVRVTIGNGAALVAGPDRMGGEAWRRASNSAGSLASPSA